MNCPVHCFYLFIFCFWHSVVVPRLWARAAIPVCEKCIEPADWWGNLNYLNPHSSFSLVVYILLPSLQRSGVWTRGKRSGTGTSFSAASWWTWPKLRLRKSLSWGQRSSVCACALSQPWCRSSTDLTSAGLSTGLNYFTSRPNRTASINLHIYIWTISPLRKVATDFSTSDRNILVVSNDVFYGIRSLMDKMVEPMLIPMCAKVFCYRERITRTVL